MLKAGSAQELKYSVLHHSADLEDTFFSQEDEIHGKLLQELPSVATNVCGLQLQEWNSEHRISYDDGLANVGQFSAVEFHLCIVYL